MSRVYKYRPIRTSYNIKETNITKLKHNYLTHIRGTGYYQSKIRSAQGFSTTHIKAQNIQKLL